MNIDDIAKKVTSYNTLMVMEGKFPKLIDDVVQNTTSPLKELRDLKKKIISDKISHEKTCTLDVEKCAHSLMRISAIRIIDIRIKKYKTKYFETVGSKYWWKVVIPIIIAFIIYYWFK